jgi:hypothetical protein
MLGLRFPFKRAFECFLLLYTDEYLTFYYSHSIVAGGLPEIS